MSILGNAVYSPDANCKAFSVCDFIPPEKRKNRWIHLFASYSAAVGFGIDGHGFTGLAGGSIIKSDKSFRIGGLMVQEPNRHNYFGGENVILQGYIDEVRVSDIIRYDPFNGGSYDIPVGKFQSDEHTIGLWHFDGGNAFKDESGNDYTLWKSEILAVQENGKLPITWGKLKGDEK
ncbi:MAG: hypothetical protein QG588_946 [Candidatus Poribacteria bacterium]|nr:hypothetical protein [Candidatus Poribacteria bacterium]